MKFLRELFVKNIGLKLISLLIGVLLWLQIANQETVQRTISVPVEFVNMPASLELASEYEKQVNIEIRTQQSGSIDERRLSAVIDLQEAQVGTEVIPLSAQNIKNLPFGAEILNITPARIRLQLESIASKIIIVEAKLEGTPAPGYEVTEVRLVPPEIVITGPQSRVQNISKAETEPIDVEGRDLSFAADVYVDLEDPRLRIETSSSVRAIVTIGEKRKQVRLRQVPVRVLPEGTRARLYTNNLTVLGTIPVSFAGDLVPSDFQAIIDLASLEAVSESYEIIPQIVPPAAFTEIFRVESITPSRVRVRKLN
ncbi:MAG: CdaR family protein [Acidobacteriota bacterium]